MIIGITMLIISFVYLLLTSIVYYSKKRIKNIENDIYSYMITTTFIGIVFELGCIFLVPIRQTNYYFNELANRGFLLYIETLAKD